MEGAAEGMARILNAGGSQETAEQAVIEALSGALARTSPRMAAELIRTAPKMLRDRQRIRRQVRRRVRADWGKALDLFMMLVVGAEEVGTDFDQRHRPSDDERFGPMYDALLGLHARACRTAFEVYHLLSEALPKGGLARARTLHELAVTMLVIADYGRRSDHLDLAERFLAHDAVATYKDASSYQLNCESLGYEPFSDAEMCDMEARRDAVVARYGPAFKEQYGWAAGLERAAAPNFRDLERLANLSHLRSYYAWASHEVHSDAKGFRQNESIWGDTLYRETSYANDGLADPGQMALISLQQCTVSLLFSPDDTSPLSIVAANAMAILVDQAEDAFMAAHQAAVARNMKLQRRQTHSTNRAARSAAKRGQAPPGRAKPGP